MFCAVARMLFLGHSQSMLNYLCLILVLLLILSANVHPRRQQLMTQLVGFLSLMQEPQIGFWVPGFDLPQARCLHLKSELVDEKSLSAYSAYSTFQMNKKFKK